MNNNILCILYIMCKIKRERQTDIHIFQLFEIAGWKHDHLLKVSQSNTEAHSSGL